MVCFQSMNCQVDQGSLGLMPGDIDVVYASEAVLSGARLSLAKTWLRNELRGIFPWPGLSIDLQDIEGRIAPLSQVQCVVPATSMFITGMGILDVRNALEGFLQWSITIDPPQGARLGISHPQAIVERYAQFPSLLVGLTAILRLQKLASRLKLKKAFKFDKDHSRRLDYCVRRDGLAALTPGAIYRLEKLGQLLQDGGEWIPGAWSSSAPGLMMDVLRTWLSKSWTNLSPEQTTSLEPLRAGLEAIASGWGADSSTGSG